MFILKDSLVFETGPTPDFLSEMTWTTYILYYSFFLAINTVGAMVSYLISKLSLIGKLIPEKKLEETL